MTGFSPLRALKSEDANVAFSFPQMETIGRTTQLMTLSQRPRRNWSHRAAALPPSENRLREQRRFKGKCSRSSPTASGASVP